MEEYSSLDEDKKQNFLNELKPENETQKEFIVKYKKK